MKTLPLVIVSAILGIALGVAVAYVEVGTVERSFTGPRLDGELGAASAAKREYARVQVDEPKFDFGTMQRGTKASHEFLFKNTGEAPLRLDVGGTSCKCTMGDIAKGPISPGETTPVKLEWTAKSLPGQFRQTATILTNDPRQQRVELVVEGVVTEATGLEPSELLIGKISADEPGQASVYIGSYGEAPLEATARMSDTTLKPELFDLVVEPAPLGEAPLDRATSAVKLTVTTQPGLPLGHIAEWVEVSTNADASDDQPLVDGELKRGKTLLIPLLGVVEGDISIHGSGWAKNLGVLMMGKIRSDRGKSSKLRVAIKGEHAEGAELTIGRVEPEWLEVSLGDPIAIREGVTHIPLEIAVPRGQKPVIRSGEGAEAGGQGEGDARVLLQTSHPTTPEVDLRVRFVVAE